MDWVDITSSKILSPFKVEMESRLIAENYSKFLGKTFFKWYRSKLRCFNLKSTFVQNNVPSYYVQLTTANLVKKMFQTSN